MEIRPVLRASDGSCVKVNQGESARITAVFEDFDGADFVKSTLDTLVVTVKDAVSGSIINLRDDQSILDANGGTVATDGTLTFFLSPEDNANVGTEVGQVERHIVIFTWTWNDGTADRTGKYDCEVHVLTNEAAA